MPLQPDPNQSYWPLLLTDDLYLLSSDLKAEKKQQVPPAQAQQAVPDPKEESQAQTQVSGAAHESSLQTEPSTPDLIWGSLERGVLILVDYPEHTLMDRPDGLFLVEVLKAVGLDFKEVATLNVSRCQTEADWAYIKGLSSRWILSFGVQPAQLPFTLKTPHYEQVESENKIILMAEPLSQIRQEVSSKKKLWNLLKQATFIR